jgi:asparagine synthase (glutamine-hydrolysing)
MNDWLGASPHVTTPNAQTLLQDFLDMGYVYDEPVGSPGIHMQSEVFRMAKGMNTPVLLNGQGADEILGGYDTFLAAELAELVLTFHPMKALKEMGQIRKLRGKSWAWGIAATGDLIAPASISNFVRSAAGRNSTSPSWLISSQLANEKPRIRSVSELQTLLMSGAGLRHLLRYEDRSSMRWSIESRLPFLDYRVVEFAMSLPGSYLCSSGITKRIARDSFRTEMPEAITQRIDKKGFSTPSSKWLTEMSPPIYKEEISRMMSRNDHPINALVMALFDQSPSQKENPQLWRVLSFASWFNRFM